ncbi:MAG TPA: hypothetical protein VD907_06935 [Verrucomicrobiae bacterium]|nr:hypothetical protein [Verrucomicrobiae bacterium]
MGINTLVKDGNIEKLDTEVIITPIKGVTGEVHYNPGLARDPSGQIWASIRSCIHVPHRPEGYNHPMHYQNFLHVGKFDEKTFEITDLKEVKPEKEYKYFQWGIEDVRLFWRDDGLHGIGVILLPMKHDYRSWQAEILIDYEAGTYKLLKDFGMPFDHSEKNWSPPEKPARLFDFIYSPTQIVLDGQIIGEDNDLFLHNGTPLIEYEDGFLSLMHIVTSVLAERTYATLAAKWDKTGRLTHHSQMFHFNVGWREKLKETIEFASALLWAEGKEGEELIVGLGVKDELTGFCRVPVSALRWEPYQDTSYYNWKWTEPPNRQELPN